MRGSVRGAVLVRVLPLSFVCAVAVGRGVFSPAIPPKARGDGALATQAFQAFQGNEAELRKKAAHDYPTDPWSEDDAFHAWEGGDAQAFADSHHVSLSVVLDALDEGMRAARARGDRRMTGSVPPCHPRVSY